MRTHVRRLPSLNGRTFTQPILRLDLDRMDDNDNRLFGISAQIAWIRSRLIR
ncbi:hypothetical protein [Bradyrhizobium guangdongense]